MCLVYALFGKLPDSLLAKNQVARTLNHDLGPGRVVILGGRPSSEP